jgi:hypothetical protein
MPLPWKWGVTRKLHVLFGFFILFNRFLVWFLRFSLFSTIYSVKVSFNMGWNFLKNAWFVLVSQCLLPVSSSVDRLNISSLPITSVCALSQRSYKPIFCILPLPHVGFVENEKAIRAKAILFSLRPNRFQLFCSLSRCNDFYARHHISISDKRPSDVLNPESEYILHFCVYGYAEFCCCCCVLIILPESADVNGLANKWVCYMLVSESVCAARERERRARAPGWCIFLSLCEKWDSHALYNLTVSISLFVLSLADGILQRCAFCFF